MNLNIKRIPPNRAMDSRTPLLTVLPLRPALRPGMVPREPIETHPFTPEQVSEIAFRFFKRGHSIGRILTDLRKRNGVSEAGNNRVEDILRYIYWAEYGRRKADQVAQSRLRGAAA